MSDTPRTDRDYVRGFEALMSRTNDEDEWVRADFARQLERELAEAQSESAQLLRNYAQLERHHNEHHDADGALQSELAEARADAERYRWLRSEAYVNQLEHNSWYWDTGVRAKEGRESPDDLDAAIDAARK